MSVSIRLTSAAVLGALLFGACNPSTSPSIERASASATPAVSQVWSEAARVRAATARFHSQQQAAAAGYERASPCVARPGGSPAMGFHYENEALLDAEFELLRPEALLYAPRKNGRLELVGVEYIVIDTGQERPWFADRPFDVGGVGHLQRAGIAHWSLHVWLWAENPLGLFAPFNPNVSCM